MNRLRVRSSAEGQVLILFAVSLLVLVGFMALAVDVGYLMSERRQLQSATDAAALAGARTLMDEGRNDSAIRASADSYLQANAGSVSGNTDITGDREYGEVEVTAEQPVDHFFLGAIYNGNWEVGATSVAAVEWGNMKSYALVALDPPGIEIGGNAEVHIDGDGSAISNGDITSSGGGSSNIFTAGGSIDAAGTIEPNENWSAGDGINEGQPTVDDPLEDLPPPDPGTLDLIESEDDAVQSGDFADCDSTCTLKPGYYKDLGTLSIKGTATMAPGIYYLEGTSIALHEGSSVLQGDGVLLYLGGSATDTKLQPKNGTIDIAASGNEMYPGGLEGMAIWIANCSDFVFQANAEFKLDGVLYAPCSHVELVGTPGNHGYQVIVQDLKLYGDSVFDIGYEEWVEIDVPGIFLIK